MLLYSLSRISGKTRLETWWQRCPSDLIAPDSVKKKKKEMPGGDSTTGTTSESPSTPPSAPTMATAANVALKPPTKLNLRENTSENWKSYKQQWQNYTIVANLAAQPEEYQVALFLHCLGPDALRVYNGLPFESEEDKKTLSKIMDKLDEFAIGEVNETYERYVFNSRDQEADESIDAYVTV